MMIPKPAKGTKAREQRARRRLIEGRERAAKDAAKLRDRFACRRCGRSTLELRDPVEAAHLRDKGFGGDGGRYSSHQRDFVTLCVDCHRGPRGVHAGFVRMSFGTAGGDGVVRFVDQVPGARR